MAKMIHEKYFPFDAKVDQPAQKITRKFLWWSWTDTEELPYKYNDPSDLLAEVNQFISANEIDDIIDFKNTAHWITVMDYDCDYDERHGGIKLTWLK